MAKKNQLRAELDAIQRRDPQRVLRVEAVHEWARTHKKSAIYREIEWDARKAALEYQYWQIRRLISLTITSEDRTPQIISLTIDRARPGGGYRSISDVISDKELSKVMLSDAINEMERLRVRYRMVRELSGVWRELDRIAKKYEQEFSLLSSKAS